MAFKKILFAGSDGLVKELQFGTTPNNTYYDDAGSGSLKVNQIVYKTMSFDPSVYGVPMIVNRTMSVSTPDDRDVLCWSNIAPLGWNFMKATEVNIVLPAVTGTGDLTGSLMDAPIVKSLSNVRLGTLPVSRGGTGLYSGSLGNDFTFPNESILVGDGTNKFTFLTASNSTSSIDALVSDGTSWSYITQSVYNTAEITVFTASGNHTWYKPSNTKMVRVIAHGAGGGGGAGANRRNLYAANGGSGGSAGNYTEQTFTISDDQVQIYVGKGGVGGKILEVGQVPEAGSPGESSSFGEYLSAAGGLGGVPGNYLETGTPESINTVLDSRKIFEDFYNNIPNYLNELGYSGASSLFSSYGADSFFNRAFGSSGGAGGAPVSDKNQKLGGNGAIITDDVVFLTRFNDDRTITNLANNGIEIVYGTNSGFPITTAGSTHIPSKQTPFFYDNENSLTHPSPSTETINRYIRPLTNVTISGDFTYEMHLYLNAYTPAGAGYLPLMVGNNLSNATAIGFAIDSADTGQIRIYTAGTYSGTVVPLGVWNHLALVRKDGRLLIFINGVRQDTGINFTINFYIAKIFGVQGSTVNNLYALNGFATEIKLTKKALYNSNFIPSNFRHNLTTISTRNNNAISSSLLSTNFFNYNESYFSNNSQVKNIFIGSGGGGGDSVNSYTGSDASKPLILLHFNDSLENYGTSNYTFNTSSANFAFNDLTPFSSGKSLSVLRSTTAANTSSFDKKIFLGTSDFTIDCWANLTNAGASGGVAIAGTFGNGGSYFAQSYLFYIGKYAFGIAGATSIANGLNKYIVYNGAPTVYFYSASNNIPTASFGTWNHVALVRQNNNLKIYVNGTGSTNVIPSSPDDFGANYIGGSNTGLYNINGYLDEFRVTLSASSDIDIKNIYEARTEYINATSLDNNYTGNSGGNGCFGSGGGGGGASTNGIPNIKQGGDGGDGYVAVISYKY